MNRIYTNENDRVVIKLGNRGGREMFREYIEYTLVDARTGKEIASLGQIDFALSVKKYFGCKGRSVREIYKFDQWYNKKLAKEISGIRRVLEGKERTTRTGKRKGKVVYIHNYGEHYSR